MTARLLLLAASLLAIPVSQGFEMHLTTGLAVTTDHIPEPVAVDGVPMTVHRATGLGVPELARRIEALWRGQGSKVKVLRQGTWTLRSRMLGTRSEVMQWRINTGTPELLWSSLDASRLVEPAQDAGVILPAGCAWGRSISGKSGLHRYLQRSARCSIPIRELPILLQRSLPPQGWHLRTVTDSSLLLDRPGADGLVSLFVNQGDAVTWLIWLRVEHRR